MKSNPTRIPYVNIQKQWADERDKLLPILDEVFSGAQFVGGEEIDKFEVNIAKLCGTKYACALKKRASALIAFASSRLAPEMLF